MIKRLNSKVLLDFSQVCENEALLQGKWNEIYSFELARHFLIVFATSLSLTQSLESDVSKPRNYADNKPPIHVSDKILSQNLHVFLFYFLLGHLRLTGDTYH